MYQADLHAMNIHRTYRALQTGATIPFPTNDRKHKTGCTDTFGNTQTNVFELCTISGQNNYRFLKKYLPISVSLY